ncbi:helix-turn-helix transcriptional regulator [Streptomyces sp. NBC_00829]|uniref:helix-turn-helix transcriptional regulator n=1 Tax=Streptomyces sp. NBC_00829 TaxID=2903679 RepID=UPI002F91AD5E|nr:helix-turn-helix transcriptional regulator [Streptomyces sp. NBC_00829]
MRAYKRVIDDEAVNEDDPGLQELLDLHAIVPNTHRPGHFVPIDPQQTAHDLLWQGYDQVARMMARLASVHKLTELLSVEYERGKWRSGGGSEYIDDPACVNVRIDKASASATDELLTAQPRRRSHELLQQSVERDSALLGRGCSMRTLYPYSARARMAESRWMERMSQIGTEVRTLHIPFPRLIIIDRRHAFIENTIVDEAPPHSGWYVTDRAVVEWIATVYDLYWDRADPWSASLILDSQVTNPTQRAILRELVAGRDQKQIAPRLSISEKTIQNQLADLRKRLGLETTMQLMYWWATSSENTSAQELQPGEASSPVPE